MAHTKTYTKKRYLTEDELVAIEEEARQYISCLVCDYEYNLIVLPEEVVEDMLRDFIIIKKYELKEAGYVGVDKALDRLFRHGVEGLY